MKDKGCLDNVLRMQYKQLFCISPGPQWWVAVLLVQQVVHRSVILDARWIHERLGEVTAISVTEETVGTLAV